MTQPPLAQRPADGFPWRAVSASIFLPNLVFATGLGAITPMISVIAIRLGCSLAGAGFIATLVVVGGLVGDVPAGALVARIGERTAIIGASLLACLGSGLGLIAWSPTSLGVAVFLIGVASALFSLARHAFMTTYVPVTSRARAMSTLGGSHRLGLLLGPFLAAWVISITGNPVASFWIQVSTAAAAGLLVWKLRDPALTLAAHYPGRDSSTTPDRIAPKRGLLVSVWDHRRVLLTVGVGVSILSALRASRQVLLPLWGVSLGLGEVTIAMVVGFAAVIDCGLFFTGGWIMDRFGRTWVVVPCLIGLSVGHITLGVTHNLPHSFEWFIAMALFLSLANGIGSGIQLTIGADLADPTDPSPFLGAWRFTTDIGSAAAPLAISAITAAASLALAASVVGIVGFAGAGILAVFLPRHAPRRFRN